MIETKPTSLYETDFALWAAQQAELLKAGDWGALDIVNLTDEVSGLERSDKRSLRSHFEVVAEHLLKLEAFPEDRSARLWRISVRNAARDIVSILDDSPSLRNSVDAAIAGAYATIAAPLSEHLGIDLPDEQPDSLRPAINRALDQATPQRKP